MAQKIDFSPCQHNIIYANHLKGTMEWNDDGLQIFEINLQPAFFANIYLKIISFNLLKRLLKKVPPVSFKMKTTGLLMKCMRSF
ncbi:hypothetical protein QW060_23530, partial [Myroides ceti]|nr:hypothetical protein [Paenimyroides ceti]